MNKIYDLKCNYETEPKALDDPSPLFSWKLLSDTYNTVQKGYRIYVSDNRNLAEKGIGNIWDSGYQLSSQSSGVKFQGSKLKSRTEYYWNVEVDFGKNEERVKGEIHTFETALMDQSDFFANWVGFLPALEGECLSIRRDIQVGAHLKKAQAYTCGLGLYEFFVNGEKCGEGYLEPAVSTFAKTVYYQSYDITEKLSEGKNTLAAMIGTGWYDRQIFWAQIYLTYEDGKEEIIYTDWAQGWTGRPGAIRQSLFGGEVVDNQGDPENWMLPEYDQELTYERPEGFIQLAVKEAPRGVMRSQPLESIKIISSWEPSLVGSFHENSSIYDTGQNMSGWVHLRYRGNPGAKITILYSEVLMKNGQELDRRNLRFAKSRNILVCDGKEHEYRPKFTYHGFRYFEMITEGEVEILSCEVEEVHTAVKDTGFFECSNDLLNRFQKCVHWTEVSNMMGIPTDCDQRDERMGWLNDITSRSVEAFFNFDVSRFYRKFMDDIADTVDEKTGAYADTAPYVWGYHPADTVSNAFIWINLLLYRFYGNKDSMKKHYAYMKGWINYQKKTEKKNHCIVTSYYGDWAAPIGECGIGTDSNAQTNRTSGDLISLSHFCRSLLWMSEVAEILNLPEDKKYYDEEYQIYRKYFNDNFYNEEQGIYENGTQTSMAVALNFRLVEESQKNRVLNNLLKNIEEHNYHVTTGNLGTRILLDTLIEYDHPEVAYRLLTQTTYPSFLYMLQCGATTMWERWENDPEYTMNSRNHPMHASNGVYLYRLLGGIYFTNHTRAMDFITIQPYIPDDLKYVKTAFDSVNGKIVSEWSQEDGKLQYHIVIPPNTKAQVQLKVKNNVKINGTDTGTTEQKNMFYTELGSGEYFIVSE